MKKILLTLGLITSFWNVNLVNADYGTNSKSIYGENSSIISNLYEDYTPIKVLLSTGDLNSYHITSDNFYKVKIGEKEYETNSLGVLQSDTGLLVYFLDYSFYFNGVILQNIEDIKILTLEKNQVLKVNNWDRTLAWDTKKLFNDNIFLGGLEIYSDQGKLKLINELDLKDYMKGIAEVPEKDLNEKRKVLQIISRSYAYYYLTEKNKYGEGNRYNAMDDPNSFQKYRGHGFTLRSPKWQSALKETEGEIITYKNKPLRAAYFSCTPESGYTNLPSEAQWSDPYFIEDTKSVYVKKKDIIGIDFSRVDKPWACGHGVGLSGYGATKRAERGDSYKDILNYYYSDIKISNITK